MSFVLLHGGRTALLGSDTSVIKASEAQAVHDAAKLLEQAERLLEDARNEQQQLRANAREQGLAEGVTAVRDEVASKVAQLADELAQSQRRRDEELAEAAMAAVKAILGEAAPDVIGPALVQQALASFVDDQPVRLEVAPELAAQLRSRLDEQVELVENPSLGPLDCELRLTSGTIRAGFDVQLDALAERWGLKTGDGR